MAEINKDLPVRVAPFFEIPENSTVVIKTYKVNVEPQNVFYKVTVIVAKVISFLSLIAWFLLLITLLILSVSILNNLEIVNTMRTQVIPSTSVSVDGN